MNQRPMHSHADVEVIAKAERFLNRVLAYHAAIAVHELRDDFGLDVQELSLSVVPMPPEAVCAYRVVCTIVGASIPQPVVLEAVVQPEKAVASTFASKGKKLPRRKPAATR